MNNPDHTRDRAMHALLALIPNVINHPGEHSNIALARQAADALAEHVIAVAAEARDQHVEAVLKDATADIPVYPDSPKGH